MLTLDLDYGQGSERIVTSLWSLAQWERKTSSKIPQLLSDGIGMDDLFFLAHATLVHRGAEVPKSLDLFIQQLVSLDLVDTTEPVGPTK